MIFARRALQRRLNELRAVLDARTVDMLAVRLNRPGKDRMAAMWEVAVLHGLAQSGTLASERALVSGRRPDIHFEREGLSFIADVTCVSDDGLDDRNPYYELGELIEKAKGKLGLPVGGVHLQVHSKREQQRNGTRTVLRLPPRGQLQAFVKNEIIPRLREQIAQKETVLRLAIDDDVVGLEVTIDPTRSPQSSGGFAAYDIPTILDRNPLYSALKSKAAQLRGAQGISGVIVGDGDCAALRDRQTNWGEVSSEAIAREFLRQHRSVDFVVMLTVREQQALWSGAHPPARQLYGKLVARPGLKQHVALSEEFELALNQFPKPVSMPVNGALRAREQGYDIGHHGGGQMGGRKIRISSREFVEILAGHRTLADGGAKFVEAARKAPPKDNQLTQIVQRFLSEGRLPRTIDVIATDEDDDDDWIEIEFGDPDPAISPLR